MWPWCYEAYPVSYVNSKSCIHSYLILSPTMLSLSLWNSIVYAFSVVFLLIILNQRFKKFSFKKNRFLIKYTFWYKIWQGSERVFNGLHCFIRFIRLLDVRPGWFSGNNAFLKIIVVLKVQDAIWGYGWFSKVKAVLLSPYLYSF